MIPQMQPWFDQKEAQALYQYILSSGWLTEHTKTREFEKAVADYVGSQYCFAVPNGTQALFLALKALGIGHGDEVLVPDFTMAATANAVVMAGGTPVFVDVGDDLCMDIGSVDRKVTKKTQAFVYVSLNGRASNLRAWREFANDYSLYFIEDAAQSLGSRYRGQHLGTFGDVGIFSFSAPKIVSCGQGGAVVTNIDWIAKKIRSLKDFGRERPGADHYLSIGYNFKFTDLQAVVGIEQMKKLPDRVERKKDIFRLYHKLLCDVPEIEFISTDLKDVAPWFMDILVPNPDKLAEHLKEKGIGTRRFYPALHSEPAYSLVGDYPKSEYAARFGLWLPSLCQLSDSAIVQICTAVREFYGA